MDDSNWEDNGRPPVLPKRVEHEPRWPTLLAVLIAGALNMALQEQLTLGPSWMLLAIVVSLCIPSLVAHHMLLHGLSNVMGYIIDGVITLFLLYSVGALVCSLPGRQIAPETILVSAAELWVTNVVLFALWYWRLDEGGPYARAKRGTHTKGAFLFPPMTADGRRVAGDGWTPRFVDYLFLAFNTSTALSPTDAPIISRWAKLLVMMQAIMSLTLVAVLVGRAVNLL